MVSNADSVNSKPAPAGPSYYLLLDLLNQSRLTDACTLTLIAGVSNRLGLRMPKQQTSTLMGPSTLNPKS